uniref:Uncharacterized protein n=1 Tax=Oryza glaberrima TaxID=4538 RepID=I1QI27_ORYGL
RRRGGVDGRLRRFLSRRVGVGGCGGRGGGGGKEAAAAREQEEYRKPLVGRGGRTLRDLFVASPEAARRRGGDDDEGGGIGGFRSGHGGGGGGGGGGRRRFAAVNMEYQITTITQSINLTPNCKFALVLLCMHHQFITNSPFLFSSPQTATRYAATGHDDLVIIIISTAAAAAKPSLLPLYCSLAKNPWPWPPESTEEVVVPRSTPVGIGTGSRHEADA